MSSFQSPIVSLPTISAIPPPARELSDPLLAYAQSHDGSMKENSPLARWASLMNEAMGATGRVAASEALLRERLEKAGFVDVQSFSLPLPIGPWAKDKYEPQTAHYHDNSTNLQRSLTGLSRSWA
jgi:hypothetical protein